MVSMKPAEVFEMLEEDLATKTPERINRIKDTIKDLYTSQVLAQWHVTWSVCQLRLR